MSTEGVVMEKLMTSYRNNSEVRPDTSCGPEDVLTDSRKIRRIGGALGLIAAGTLSLGAAQNAHASLIVESPIDKLTPIVDSPQGIEQHLRNVSNERREKIRCKRQLEMDDQQFSSCQYKSVYVTLSKRFPKWTNSHRLDRPGVEEKSDRKKAYFKTNPGEYRLMLLEGKAGKYYESPRGWVWDSVNSRECNDTWDCNTGNGYYGGLQMDLGFQRTYNPTALRIWGTANNWPQNAQELAADRAYDGYQGYGARGLTPWPSSYAALGSYPVPINR